MVLPTPNKTYRFTISLIILLVFVLFFFLSFFTRVREKKKKTTGNRRRRRRRIQHRKFILSMKTIISTIKFDRTPRF